MLTSMTSWKRPNYDQNTLLTNNGGHIMNKTFYIFVT